ncbi:hypothetical protein A6U92_05435 [Agrobacterium rubi]|nr:hypothetical protein A6U92_05435 [Agrobacterium rubi]
MEAEAARTIADQSVSCAFFPYLAEFAGVQGFNWRIAVALTRLNVVVLVIERFIIVKYTSAGQIATQAEGVTSADRRSCQSSR